MGGKAAKSVACLLGLVALVGAGIAVSQGRATRVAPLRAAPQADAPRELVLYVGSGYPGHPPPFSLRTLAVDPASGALEEIQSIPLDAAASFLVPDASGTRLYVNVQTEPSRLALYAIDRATGLLRRRSEVTLPAQHAAHLSLDPAGRFALQAHYESHEVTVTRLGEDGSPGAVVGHAWQWPSAYPHCVVTDPSGRFAFVANRTGEAIAQYRFDPQTGALTPNEPFLVTFPPRSGPRHIVFDPHRPVAFVVHEAAPQVSVLDFGPERGTLRIRRTVSTVPEGFDARNNPADLKLHPSGRFLYVVNRGHASVAIFRVDERGDLAPAGHAPVVGWGPRNLALDPAGRFLAVGVLSASAVQLFRVDEATGALTETGPPVALHTPSGIAFVALPGKP